jgi:phospholipid/cholesterol/gamma-HCH transport system ATP-binding protein
MSEPVIEVSNLSVGWDARTLLEDLSFQVFHGEIFVILGGSGSGKSTLLRHLIGLARPMAGEVRVLGSYLHETSPTDVRAGPPPYGVMFQFGALLGSLSVGENVALPLTQWTDLPVEAIRVITRAKLRLVGMQDAEEKLPSELSGGMQKRADIALALVLEPPLLFLDEPSAGLDPIHAAELDLLIKTLNTGLGVTVVLVTHDLESLYTVGTRCILLDGASKGILCEGEPRTLRDTAQDPRVKAFLHRHPLRDEER